MTPSGVSLPQQLHCGIASGTRSLEAPTRRISIEEMPGRIQSHNVYRG